jgi:hypothetical protein
MQAAELDAALGLVRWTTFRARARGAGAIHRAQVGGADVRIRVATSRFPGELRGAIEKTNSSETKLCRISAALRQGSNGDNDFVGVLVIRNEHHRRDASLDSSEVQFPKLDVAGSIPVSRFSFQELNADPTLAVSNNFQFDK